jgi:hypothetical protein
LIALLWSTTAFAGSKEEHTTPAGHTVRRFHQEEADGGTRLRMARTMSGISNESAFPPMLTLLLPGAAQSPVDYRALTHTVMAAGHHVLVLSYPNRPRVHYRCRNESPECHGEARLEMVTGEDRSPVLEIGLSDSIEGRLRASLAHLAVTFPHEAWSSFFQDGEPVWSKIHLIGHDEGGACSLKLAQRHELARVVLVGDMGAQHGTTSPATIAPWVSEPLQTGSERIYGMIHREETRHDAMIKTWTLARLDSMGEPTPTSAFDPLTDQSHLLVMTAPVPADVDPADALITDAGVPTEEEARKSRLKLWSYLLGFE